MTLPNTRAAGLRQAAEFLRSKRQEMNEDLAAAKPSEKWAVTVARATLLVAIDDLDRMAQEAEGDER